MVKLYITTDRNFRHNVRCNKKNLSELKDVIKKKTDEVHMYIERERQLYNSYVRSRAFNKTIYETYSDLYVKNAELDKNFNNIKKSLCDAEEKLKETTELYKNLEDIYNEKVSECERLKKDVKTEIKEENIM
jgi:membrane-bound lytic murein transglycosylase